MKKFISMLLVCLIFFNIFTLISYAGVGEKILAPIADGYGHNALRWQVSGVASSAPLQAFVVAWNITFTSKDGTMSTTIKVPREMNYWGANPPANVYPLTAGWNSSTDKPNGIPTGTSIADYAKYLYTYNKIISSYQGCDIEANAVIQKYAYDSSKSGAAAYTPINNSTSFANSPDELGVIAYNSDGEPYVKSGNFKEFSIEYINNARSQYFEIKFSIPPEVLDPSVTIDSPTNTTVYVGTTVQFTGTGTNCHHMAGFINGIATSTQLNPKSITDQMTYSIPYTFKNKGVYTFQVKGRADDTNTSKLAESNIITVYVIEKPIDSGAVYIKYYDATSMLEIPGTSRTLVPVQFGVPTTVKADSVSGYIFKGSTQSFSNITPSPVFNGIQSQTITLSTSNQNAYVSFFLDLSKGPIAIIDAPDTVRAGDSFSISGSRSYCQQVGATIKDYTWNVNVTGQSGEVTYTTPGIHTLSLTVTDSNGLTGSTTKNITVTPPTPTAYFTQSGKIKENRKITITNSSSTPEAYPLDQSKTTWRIEPVTGTGATWDCGIRMSDGTVKKLTSATAQSFLDGQARFDFQARDSGQYKVTLYVTNTYPASNTYVGYIAVMEDLAPISGIDGTTPVYREFDNPTDITQRKYGSITLIDKSYSPDGDNIYKRTWVYRSNVLNNKNSDGSPNYSDDKTQYAYTGDISAPFTEQEIERLVVLGDNALTADYYWYGVGDSRFEIVCEEQILDSETIKELLLPTDIRRSKITGW